MLLVIDVGNTQTVVGLYEPVEGTPTSADHGLVEHWRIATHANRTADEHAVLLWGFLVQQGVTWEQDLHGVAISSVVPRVTTDLRDLVERYLKLDPVVLEPGVKTGVSILYENPQEVGADRIANAAAAYDLYGGPTVMVDLGTATTCDAISADGEYLGGAITPGIEISLSALFEQAAALRQVELSDPGPVLGKSTSASLRSGVVYGYAGLVDAMVSRIEEDLGDCTVVATGGLAELIVAHAESVDHVEPWLTLHGLRLVHARNT